MLLMAPLRDFIQAVPAAYAGSIAGAALLFAVLTSKNEQNRLLSIPVVGAMLFTMLITLWFIGRTAYQHLHHGAYSFWALAAAGTLCVGASHLAAFLHEIRLKRLRVEVGWVVLWVVMSLMFGVVFASALILNRMLRSAIF
jgi:hypothetical protein